MTLQKQIANKIKEKKGVTLIGIMLGVLAFGILAFPMARWIISMTQTIAMNEKKATDIGIQLEMQAVMEDRWHIINDMSIDQLMSATTKTTTYGKYTVKEEYATAGRYNAVTGACISGTPSETEQLCRQVTLTVTGPEGTTPLGPVTAVRVASSSTRLDALEARMTAAEGKFGNYYTKTEADSATKSTINSSLLNYYTKSTIDSMLGSYAKTSTVNNSFSTINNKFNSYYTKPETDEKVAAISSGGGYGYLDVTKACSVSMKVSYDGTLSIWRLFGFESTPSTEGNDCSDIFSVNVGSLGGHIGIPVLTFKKKALCTTNAEFLKERSPKRPAYFVPFTTYRFGINEKVGLVSPGWGFYYGKGNEAWYDAYDGVTMISCVEPYSS